MNQVALKDKPQAVAPHIQLRNDLARMDGEFASALPEHVSVDKFKRVILTAAQTNNDLMQADRLTFLKSCIQCAADGLLPDGREAALVVFNTKIKGKNGDSDVWIKQVQYMPMTKGLIKLARNSGDISNLVAQIVCKNDTFNIDLASGERPTHNIPLDKPRGDFIAAYAIATFKDGSFQTEFMTKSEIDKIKSISKGVKKNKDGSEYGIWVDWYEEMARKTVLKRLVKYLSLSPELNRAVDNDNQMYDLDKLSLSQNNMPALTTNLNEGWEAAKEEPIEDTQDEIVEANVSAPEDDYLDDLKANINEAIMVGDVIEQFEEFQTSSKWNTEAQQQADFLKGIFAPKIKKLGFGGVSIPPTEAAYLCMLWATDDAAHLNGMMEALKSEDIKLSASALAIKAIRQKELSNGK